MSGIYVCDDHGLDLAGARKAQRVDPPTGLGRLLERMLAVLAARRERRRTLALLTRLSDCQLRDIGLDPAAVYGERVGTIDEVHGDRFHGL